MRRTLFLLIHTAALLTLESWQPRMVQAFPSVATSGSQFSTPETPIESPIEDPSFQAGNQKFNNRDYLGAIRDYEAAILSRPNDPRAYLNRALAYLMLKEHQKVIQDCDRVIALTSARKTRSSTPLSRNPSQLPEPQSDLVYTTRGLANLQLSQFQQAIGDFTQAIALNPDNAINYLSRGIAHIALQDKPQAIADLEKSIVLYQAQNKPQEAEKAQKTLTQVKAL